MSDRTTNLSDWVSETFGLRFVPPSYWAHTQVRFDVLHSLLSLRPGEDIIKSYNQVVDSKGNINSMGSFWITNMRLLWFLPGKKINLSIGWDAVTGVMHAKTMDASAVVLASSGTKYEFIFTCKEPDFVESLEDVFKMYNKSKPYRDTIFRSHDIISNGSLLIMKKESMFEKITGVFHLSSEAGTIGNLIITNVRIVWYTSESNSNLNIPYLQMTKIGIQKSKYGEVLVVNVQTSTKPYMFGFRIDPLEKMKQTQSQIANLWRLYHDKPIFGVDMEDGPDNFEADVKIESCDDLKITVMDNEDDPAWTKESLNSLSTDIMFSEYLGLAIKVAPERIDEIQNIWEGSF